MIEIQVRFTSIQGHTRDVADALKELKKRMKQDGTLDTLRKKECFLPKSKRARLKRLEARSKRYETERKLQHWNKKTQ